MVSFSLGKAALTATTVLASVASAVEYVVSDGANFIVNSTGNRFDIIGVTYQPGGSSGFTSTADPLSDATTCLRDAIIMQQLGVNTIRVYNVDANLSHDECASIFNAAGIYMIIDVNSGLYGQYIDRTDPSSTYTLDYMEHIFGVVENFWNYPNLLGYFAGNEIINEQSSSDAPLYIRAVVRDLREYISLHAPRTIGVGYSAADVQSELVDTFNYLACTLTNDTMSKIDFFGLNDYEWCGDSSFTSSGYDDLVTYFAATDIPVFFSEYGCNAVTPRTFTNVPVLYGSDMTELSGGLVYEYSQESDDYGIVAINSTDEITLLIDYSYLKSELASIDYSSLTTANKTAEEVAAFTCNTALIASTTGSWVADWGLPDRPSGGDSLVTSGLTATASVTIGALVSVTATDMPATVYNYTGAEVTGLALVSMGCADINYPGLIATYTAGAETCSYATSTAVSAGTSDSASAAARAYGGVDTHAIGIAGVVLASFIAGVMIL
ncbi:Glucanosyltransferase-domain-containing protein [Xylariales sp. PMI_506]|nr:Glucanosyltransferase-domain-containing protein [Xylariales sp. PMI_506]